MPGQCHRRLKILQVSARYSPFVGGTEIHTGQVAGHLVERGHDVTVVSTQIGDSLPAVEKVDGVEIIRVPAWSTPADFYIAPEIRDVVAGDDWDIVHVQGYHTVVAPIALRAALERDLTTVLTFHSGGHSSGVRNRLRPLHVKALSAMLRRTDLLVGVSDFEARLFSRWLDLPDGRIAVVPNGVSNLDSGEGQQPQEQARSHGDRRTILSIGRLVRYKGHHRILRSLPHLLDTHPDVHLMILGSGPYESKLRRLTESLQLTDHVTFDSIPSHERQRMTQVMKEASLAVLLSDYESHGMAAHEALSSGLPLIVLDRAALSDLAAAGLAGAVPPSANEREIARIVARNLDRIEREGPQVDQQRLLSFGGSQPWSEITLRLEELYLETIEGRRR